MKITTRYILREHAGPLMFALTALTSLLLLNYIAKQFGNLVGKGLAWSVIGEFFLLSIPFTVAMTLPMAALVATLYAFSRLAAEAEITAFKASGVSMARLLAPVLIVASVMSLLMVVFNDQALPRANHRLSTLQTDIARKKPTFALKEQVINEVVADRLFLRAGHIDEATNGLREVTIYDLSNPERRRTIYADSGSMAFTPDLRDIELTLYDGYMQELTRAEPGQLQRLFYDTDRILVRDIGNQLHRSTSTGMRSEREMGVCEMQRNADAAGEEYGLAHVRLRRLASAGMAVGDTVDVEGRRRESGVPGIGTLYCQLAGAVVGGGSRLVALATGDTSTVYETAEALHEPTSFSPFRYDYDASDTTVSIAPSTGGLSMQVEQARLELGRTERIMDSYNVEIQKKFALAVAPLVFALLGAPIALRFPRGGVGLVLGVSLAVFALYYVALIGGETVGDEGIVPPALAMWSANILLAAIGFFLLARMGRETSTSRGGDARELGDAVRSWLARQARRAGIPVERRGTA